MVEFEVHQDADLFREAIRFTSVTTGFSERLIEKDWYCSVVLQYLASNDEALVFKGGTSLNKIHAGFYRLSEDLDFCISMPVDSARSARSGAVRKMKRLVDAIPKFDAAFEVRESLRGFNNSIQYGGVVSYRSMVTGNADMIKVEVSLREPVVQDVEVLPASTLLLDPFRNSPFARRLEVTSLSKQEAYAEKVRAALTRRDVAIRDFFDLDYAIQNSVVDFSDSAFVELAIAKLAILDNSSASLDDARIETILSQLDSQLRPVLRTEDLRTI